LEELEHIRIHDLRYLPKDAERRCHEAIERWFKHHQQRIEDVNVGLPLLPTLLPETRTDRVYGLKEKSLEKTIGRALALPQSRHIDLGRWRQPGAGDLEIVYRESCS
jgi:DNA ligase-4